MKKIIGLSIGIIYSFIITSHANAQFINGKNAATIAAGNSVNTAKHSKSEEKLNKAGFKSLKAFNKDFKNENGVKWYVEPQVITASFASNDVKTNVVFNKKGQMLRTVKTYQEDKMDRAIRAIVKSKYFDDKISQVQEITEGGITFYIVYLENDSSYKIVSVYDGEMNVYQDIRKQS